MAIEQDTIEQALYNYLQTMNPSPDIVLPNESYTPSQSTPYVQARVSFVNSTEATLGKQGHKTVTGMLMLDIFVPEGSGIGAMLHIQKALTDHFPQGWQINTTDYDVQRDTVKSFSAVREESWTVKPLVINFTAVY